MQEIKKLSKYEIANKTYDEERALYNIKDTRVFNCKFKGKNDGESVLKECRDIDVVNCEFSLRYPLWHAKVFTLLNSEMDELTRAPIWYSENGKVKDCTINGIKSLRECHNIELDNCKINSPEFGWKCSEIKITTSEITSEYFLFETNNVEIDKLKMNGKYSFQYMSNLHITNSKLDTKDSFWHSKNVLVEDSIVKGEYLGWFSENLTLKNCKIIGTQPLCYCKNLKLVNCTMEKSDFAFEYSEVEADIKGSLISVKNPKSGYITVDSVDEIIMEDAVMETNGKVIVREKQLT